MFNLPNYYISEPIKISVNTEIYRGYRYCDSSGNSFDSPQPVILKILAAEYPTVDAITLLKHEYELTKNLYVKGIIRTYKLEKYQNILALILEDFEGESLKSFLGHTKLKIQEIIEIVIQLASTLGELHKNKIIHKDIKPANIIINSATRQVKITDFSIASRLEKENQTIANPNLLEGTLAYMSPEQTGRMNRSLDYRTDFYSLGVTFYEMLTGQLPFQTKDPMELVHCHIAKIPPPPHQLNPDIPTAVSDIVMKLLAKTAENRYQSACGLKADLENCLNQLRSTGKISHFSVGSQDLSGELLIPQKLYGREAEIANLMATFERVSLGATEMMLVSGYSGIGKSCLVNEIHKPIVRGRNGADERSRAYFTSGKFDQFKRNIPYAALIQAFQELMRQLLTESIENIELWKSKLLAAFGPNGQVIIDVIPEVERIVGQQPPVPLLGPTESQNRFNLVFQKFIRVFTQKEHPLVLFLDDLQWADSASLKLIHLLMSDPDSKYLLLIGAYRDNEVGAAHPLMLTLEDIQKNGGTVHNIILQNLDVVHINQLIADTMHCKAKISKPLAELLKKKTQGNPFFLTQLLKSLYQDNLLLFDFNEGRWQWDIEQIYGIGISENVVELTIANLKKFAINTQKVLQLAACIGNKFNLNVLAIVNEKSLSETAVDLWEALQAGLILPLSNSYKIPLVFEENEISDRIWGFETRHCQSTMPNHLSSIAYKFLHDRIQQAAYALIPDDRKKEVHLKIGQLLLKNTSPDNLEENIFEIVNHINVGSELITEQEERYKIAKFNLLAGRKAKEAAAYEPAVKYLTVGLSLLAEDSWLTQYDLTLALYLETLEAEYLNANYEGAEPLFDVILQKAKTLLDKVKVYEIKTQFYICQNKLTLAIDNALEVLDLLGICFPQDPKEIDLACKSIQAGIKNLTAKQIEELIDFPELTDPAKLAAMRILMAMVSAVFIAKPILLQLVISTMVDLSIKYGNSKLAAFGYAFYGVFFCSILGDIETGYSYSQLGFKVLERFDAKEVKCKTLHLVNVCVSHWKKHIRETKNNFVEAVNLGLEVGDIEYAGFAAIHYCSTMFFSGESIENAVKVQVSYLEFVEKLKQEFHTYYIKPWLQLSWNLQGLAEDKCRLIGESFNEEEMLPQLVESNNGSTLFCVYLAKSILFYLFKESDNAVAAAALAEKYLTSVPGFLVVAEHNFYYSLALVAAYPKANEHLQKEYLKKLESNQEQMQEWACHAPCNFKHKYELLEAEKARVIGNVAGAIAYYDRAIKAAREQGYIQEEALAYELAAEFYLALGGEETAQTYMTKAYYGYLRWGAKAKVQDLETRYRGLILKLPVANNDSANISPGLDITSTTTFSTQDGRVLDLTAVMKATQAIASEIVLESLLGKLMKIAIENAGAQSGLLILEKDGELRIKATGSVDTNEFIACPTTPAVTSDRVPLSAIDYVTRTQSNVVLNDATVEGIFTRDPYIIKNQPKSVMCTPIINQGKFIGILYLENNLTTGAFTAERLKVLKIIASQAAISIENARLYSNLSKVTENLKLANEQLEDYNRNLENKVNQRTLELNSKNLRLKEQANQLKQALEELKSTQTQLIQTEKMSSLGQLVAGIAHEINNPINFIYGNIDCAEEYIQDLLALIDTYQHEYPKLTPKIIAETEAIELEFIVEDLPKILSSMRMGADRIHQIVLSLRNFSRLDESGIKRVDIHSGIDSTLSILQYRLKGHGGNSEIQVIKKYGNLPLIECYAGQLNQVFMNILSNAIDALENKTDSKLITINTETLDSQRVAIRIADNGPGMTDEVRSRVFDPFFTTKSVGKGTGLGLSISYQIVVNKHGGQLKFISSPRQGTEFAIEIPILQNCHPHKGYGPKRN